MPKKGQRLTGRHARGLPRPHVWIIGPDEQKHKMYHPWQMSKAQAIFRDEGWDLSFEEYYELWKNDWDNRGRKSENMCMTRIDASKPWTIKNVEIVMRLEHLRRQNAAKWSADYKGKKPGRKPKAKP